MSFYIYDFVTAMDNKDYNEAIELFADSHMDDGARYDAFVATLISHEWIDAFKVMCKLAKETTTERMSEYLSIAAAEGSVKMLLFISEEYNTPLHAELIYDALSAGNIEVYNYIREMFEDKMDYEKQMVRVKLGHYFPEMYKVVYKHGMNISDEVLEDIIKKNAWGEGSSSLTPYDFVDRIHENYIKYFTDKSFVRYYYLRKKKIDITNKLSDVVIITC